MGLFGDANELPARGLVLMLLYGPVAAQDLPQFGSAVVAQPPNPVRGIAFVSVVNQPSGATC
jgi:hypothetical protein